jgi:predicted kinase
MSPSKVTPNKPFVVFLYGFPGSGKTFFARQLAEEIGAAHLQQDRIIYEMSGENVGNAQKASRNTMNYMMREFLRAGVSVVYDADVYRRAERRILRDAVRKAKAVPVLIWLQIDQETAMQRTQKRDRRKSDDHYAKEHTRADFEAALMTMQNPENEEYVVISGKHTFHTQRAAVFKKFYELGLLTPNELGKSMAKPGLVNLIPQNKIGVRGDIIRRNINIR